MEVLGEYLALVKGWIWSIPLFLLLLGAGFYFTFLLKGIQFRKLVFAFREALAPSHPERVGDISHFQSLMTTLAGAIGTGSIVGVTTSLLIGGLGALFWLWVFSLLGMATKYAESFLAVKFRVTDENGEMIGGPMEYMSRGLNWKGVALAFACLGILGSLTTGNLVQTNSIVQSVESLFGIHPLVIGVAIALCTGSILLGGVKSIGRMAGIIVPFMALLYLVGGLWILVMHYSVIPMTLGYVFQEAFSFSATSGGLAGAGMLIAMREGIARGVFTTESGLGISTIAAAAAQTDSAVRQGLINMTGAFATMVISTMTALVVGVTVLGSEGSGGQTLQMGLGPELAIDAFRTNLIGGGVIVAIGLILFAYTTLIAWAYYGEKCCEYIFGANFNQPFRVLFTLVIIPGAIIDVRLAWELADIANGLMAIPNVVALLALSPIILRETRRFFAQ
ncbi:MAG: sodium:alanine symporter family protein [Chlamydiia bacterium]|nr:sodium:alanine symporter family protein [Chlamydiia bacterium]